MGTGKLFPHPSVTLPLHSGSPSTFTSSVAVASTCPKKEKELGGLHPLLPFLSSFVPCCRPPASFAAFPALVDVARAGNGQGALLPLALAVPKWPPKECSAYCQFCDNSHFVTAEPAQTRIGLGSP